MEEVRLGTIGSGVIVHSILDNVKRTDGIRLEAVYSRSGEKGRALADEYGCGKAYTDMDAFLADEAVNTVYIATPNLLHYEQAKRALLAGKHVLCEKPFVTLSAQAAELAAIAEEKELMLVEMAPTSFLPNYRALCEALPKIGRVKLVLANYSQYSSRYDKLLAGELPNIFNPEYAGGCLMDINFYNVYLTVALFGKPKEAAYHANLFDGKYDTSGVALLRYDGFTASCAGAKDTWGVNAYQIEGEKGYLYVKNGSNGVAELRIVTKNGEETVNLQSDPDRWYYEVQEVARLLCAEDRAAFRIRMETTQTVVGVLEQLRASAGIRFPGDK